LSFIPLMKDIFTRFPSILSFIAQLIFKALQ
jgi:hypothetical protein